MKKLSGNSSAQGAFEYLMSYGWAILVIAVLGIVLYNLGVFSPAQTSIISGFNFLKPLSVQVDPVSQNSFRVTLQLVNAGGKDLQVNSVSLTPQGGSCIGNLERITDASGSVLSLTQPYWLSAGQDVKLTYLANGTGCNQQSTNYNYKLSFSGLDIYGIKTTDTGTIRGKIKCQRPQNGVVSYWSFPEGRGTTTIDESGNGNFGTLEKAPTWVAENQGYSLLFNGSNYVSIGDVASLNMSTSDFTLSAWIKYANPGSNWVNYIITKGHAGAMTTPGSRGFALSVFNDAAYPPSNNHIFAYIWRGDDSWSKSAMSPLVYNDSNWHHVAATYSRTGNLVLFVDGSSVQQTDISSNQQSISSPLAVSIGSNYAGQDAYFNGSIDGIAVYNRTLSASEVQQIYNCGLP